MCPLCSPVAGETETLTVTVHRRNKAKEENLKQRSHRDRQKDSQLTVHGDNHDVHAGRNRLVCSFLAGKRTEH